MSGRARGGAAPRVEAAYGGVDLWGDAPAAAPPAAERPATRPQAAPVPPAAGAPAEPAPAAPAAPQPPRALRLRRDFTARREIVWGCDGRRFVARSEEFVNRSSEPVIPRPSPTPDQHVYTAYELGDETTHRKVVRLKSPSMSGVQSFGRIDTRRRPPERRLAEVTSSGVRQSKTPAPATDRDLFDWQLRNEAEARDLVRELCPETVHRIVYKDANNKDVEVTVGVYDRPGDVLLTIDPAFRFAAAKAAWRPT